MIAADCADVTTLRSTGPSPGTSLLVVNEASEARLLYWVDFDGRRQLLQTVAAGAQVQLTSYHGHVFMIGRPDTSCVATYTIPASVVRSFWLITAVDRYDIRQYFAEGVANGFFTTRLALLNPTSRAGAALLRFQRSDGRTLAQRVMIPAERRKTIVVNQLPGLEAADFSVVVESEDLLLAERTVTWDATGYGSHAEASAVEPSTTWYLAEGATTDPFSLFYLLQNPNPDPVTVTIRYLRPAGSPVIEHTRTLPPRSRTTIPVDTQAPELAAADVSGAITASAPIIVERAMYWTRPGEPFAAGHGSLGVTAPALNWFLAEGATGVFFDLFVLLANPSSADAEVSVEYLLSEGTVHRKPYTVAAGSRRTIWVDDESIPGVPGKPLASAAVSTVARVTNGVPIVVERAMWWPGPEMSSGAFWIEAHNSPGTTTTGTRWALAEGEVGGAQGNQTFILIANTSHRTGDVDVRVFLEDAPPVTRTFQLVASSRRTLDMAAEFPEVAGKRFGVLVTSTGAAGERPEIVVERAMYTSPGGILWAAGTNAVASRLDGNGALGNLCSSDAMCPFSDPSLCGHNYGYPMLACRVNPEQRRKICVQVGNCPYSVRSAASDVP